MEKIISNIKKWQNQQVAGEGNKASRVRITQARTVWGSGNEWVVLHRHVMLIQLSQVVESALWAALQVAEPIEQAQLTFVMHSCETIG